LTLTAKDVAEILRLLDESSFDSLTLEMDGVKLELRRGSAAPPPQSANAAAPSVSAPPEPSRIRLKARPPSEPGLTDISSPFLGIFYRAPRPNEPPFVEVGSQVEEDTLIGIAEVMKMMNPIRAGLKGEIVEILSENGALVEYGETLMRVRAGTLR
jgi:acetyl-CoA carboxylase biotin carboxyl carrier protein